jgi:hypothetical protein
VTKVAARFRLMIGMFPIGITQGLGQAICYRSGVDSGRITAADGVAAAAIRALAGHL